MDEAGCIHILRTCIYVYVSMYMMGVTTVKETEAIHLKAIIECLLERLEEEMR